MRARGTVRSQGDRAAKRAEKRREATEGGGGPTSTRKLTMIAVAWKTTDGDEDALTDSKMRMDWRIGMRMSANTDVE